MDSEKNFLQNEEDKYFKEAQNHWWYMYENLQNGVYISDTKTYEIIYLNRYCSNMFGFDDPSSYLGKKCYKVLQGLTHVCSFCTNKKLKYGEMYEWIYDNPILHGRYLLKDTIFEYGGRTLRIELIYPIDVQTNQLKPSFSHHSEYVSHCLKCVNQSQNLEESVFGILQYAADMFDCRSVAIFSDKSHNQISMDYEYINPKYTLSIPNNESSSELPTRSELWDEMRLSGRGVSVARGSEKLEKYPIQKAIHEQYDLTNLVLEPLIYRGNVMGFVGGVNMPDNKVPIFTSFLTSISPFLVNLLKSLQTIDLLHKLGYTDALTGAQNNNAFLMHYDEICNSKSSVILGVVYFDISNLKTINTTLGHQAGDDHIINCYKMICKVFDYNHVYRIAGDEFVALEVNIDKKILHAKVDRLKKLAVKSGIEIAIGISWGTDGDIRAQIREADIAMYADKQENRQSHMIKNQSVREDRNIYISKDNITAEDFLNYIYEGKYEINTLFHAISAEDVPYCLFLGDLKSNLFYISDSMRQKFGIQEHIVPHFFRLWANRIELPEERQEYEYNLSEMLNGKRDKLDLRYRVRDCNNQLVWVRCRAMIQRDATDNTPMFYTGFISWQENNFSVDFITGFARDISAQKFLYKISKSGELYSAIAFTPNNIRELNEARGRNATDKILQQLSVRLSNELSSEGVFFRLDGVRFLGLFRYENSNKEDDIANRIRLMISDIYQDNNILLQEACTLTLMRYPCDMEPKEFLGAVITALRVAKNSRIRTSMQSDPQLLKQHFERSALSLALSNSVMNNYDGFYIVVQPIVSSITGKIVKGEVLLRWRNGNQNVSPAVFIPILEQADLMISVGKWVFEQAVKLCQECLTHTPEFHLSFNVSYVQLQDEEFIDFMEKTLRQYGVKASHLTMELTENHFNDNPEVLEIFIEKCREIGLSVALDDFGNGYSSLGLLMRYPADIIKLDKSILENMSTSYDNAKFIKTLIYACHEFGKSVITEGVESEQEKDLVCHAGSDMIQGYYYYKPLEIEELHKVLLKEHK